MCASVMLIESRLDLDDPDGLHVEFFGLLTKLCSERVDVGLESRPFRHQAIEVGTHLRSLGSHGGCIVVPTVYRCNKSFLGQNV